MTCLHVFSAADPENPTLRARRPERIRRELAAIGVRYEQWEIDRALPPQADTSAVLDAYRKPVDRMCAEGGYTLVDVASVHPDPADPKWPDRAREARTSFLEEHYHEEDEVRFFAGGTGCFYLHSQNRVYAVLCTAGDLISVPARTAHWFDMGSEPDFTAVRFFRSADGWIGTFLPHSLAARFPTMDELLPAAREAA
ncbi:1,2-dihydroxy-3-keto-5-methylthiopentene dioxygenase [Streptomyces sp. NPDC017529]|uniref:1,2-dihydroxy-3-keto-5-methylthiopentene dioxygenase n=1 Tax=Streptomyces sp. NPDC017529 TaxID=3365000 RepID=UPI0037AF5E9D